MIMISSLAAVADAGPLQRGLRLRIKNWVQHQMHGDDVIVVFLQTETFVCF